MYGEIWIDSPGGDVHWSGLNVLVERSQLELTRCLPAAEHAKPAFRQVF